MSRVLVSRLMVKFAGEKVQDTNAFDIYKLFEDFFLPKAHPKGSTFKAQETWKSSDVKVSINGVPNKVNSQGQEPRDKQEEVLQHFAAITGGNTDNNTDATDFYTEYKFGLFIDLQPMKDCKMHISGIQLVITKDGVQLKIQRTRSVSCFLKCHIDFDQMKASKTEELPSNVEQLPSN